LDDTIDFIQTNQLAGTKGIEGKVTHLKPSE
jgi:hypothetical protein